MYKIEHYLRHKYKEQFDSFDFGKGIQPWSIYAFNPKVSTGSLPAAFGGFYVTGGNVRNLNYPENLKVSSSNVQDNDSAAAQGARQVVIEGITPVGEGGARSITETVALNGQTAVTTVNKFSVVNFAGINHIGMGASQNLSNLGTIYIGKGSVSSGVNSEPDIIIHKNAGVSENGLYMVPRGKRLYITKLTVNLITLGRYAQNQAVFFMDL